MNDPDEVPAAPEGYHDAWTTSEWHRDDVDELLDELDDEVPA